MKKIRAVFAVSLALTATSLAGPSLVTNGSFETGPEIPNLFETYWSPSTVITGWTVMPQNIDYVCPDLWAASDGERSVDLSGARAGGIMQDVATVVGVSYLVEFDLSGNPAGGNCPPIKQMNVVAGSQSQVFSFDTTGRSFRDMGWVARQWTFVAESATTTLQFISLDNCPYGPVLDNVKVTETDGAVPAPGAVLLGSLGAGLVGWMRRRKAL